MQQAECHGNPTAAGIFRLHASGRCSRCIFRFELAPYLAELGSALASHIDVPSRVELAQNVLQILQVLVEFLVEPVDELLRLLELLQPRFGIGQASSGKVGVAAFSSQGLLVEIDLRLQVWQLFDAEQSRHSDTVLHTDVNKLGPNFR